MRLATALVLAGITGCGGLTETSRFQGDASAGDARFDDGKLTTDE